MSWRSLCIVDSGDTLQSAHLVETCDVFCLERMVSFVASPASWRHLISVSQGNKSSLAKAAIEASVSIDNEALSDDQVKEIARQLDAAGCVCRSLQLSNAQLSDGVVAATLAGSLSRNRTLQTLSLQSNRVGDKAAEAIAAALKVVYCPSS